MRERLPDEREGVTHHFCIITKDGETVKEIDGYLQIGLYPDGRVGELFLKVGKSGDFHAVLDQFAVAYSIALQEGAPFEAFTQKFVGARFEPFGMTKNKEIPFCTSVLDYCARFLLLRFGKRDTVAA